MSNRNPSEAELIAAFQEMSRHGSSTHPGGKTDSGLKCADGHAIHIERASSLLNDVTGTDVVAKCDQGEFRHEW